MKLKSKEKYENIESLKIARIDFFSHKHRDMFSLQEWQIII